MKKVITVLITFVGLTFNLTISAQPTPPTPEEQAQTAFETRHAVFELISWNFGAIAGMMRPADRGGAPFDAGLVEQNAKRIANLAEMIPDLFAHDTREFELDTRALERIWEGPGEFASHANALVAAANELAEVAAGGDKDATLAALRKVGPACGDCHDIYRAN